MRIRRSVLYVPGNKPTLFEKAIRLGADVICFELQEAVPESDKSKARKMVWEALRSKDFTGIERTVRINFLDSKYAEDDIEVIANAEPDALVVTKCHGTEEIMEVESLLNKYEKGDAKNKIKIMPVIESAKGILNINRIVLASDRITALFYGKEDIYAEVGAKMSAIKEGVLDLAKELGLKSKNSFGVRANIVSSEFKSRDVEKEVGAFIQQKTKAKVNLTKPKFWLRVDVVKNKAFIYSDIIQGLGGLPLGTGGKVIALMSDKEKDILASWMMMRRGAEVIPLHLRSDEKALTQFQKNVKKLNRFAWGSRIKAVSIKQDKDMKKNLKKLVEQTGAKAYVFGNTEFHARKADLPVFEPLIGLDKKELKKLMDQLGFEPRIS